MTNVVPFKKLSIKQGLKTQYFVILKNIQKEYQLPCCYDNNLPQYFM